MAASSSQSPITSKKVAPVRGAVNRNGSPPRLFLLPMFVAAPFRHDTLAFGSGMETAFLDAIMVRSAIRVLPVGILTFLVG